MRKYLIATHGTFAKGIRSSVELILGEQKNLDTLCAYTTADFDLQKAIEERLEKLGNDDELIIMTDVLGGSVNNAFMNCLNNPNVHVITGVNLALVISLMSESDDTDVRTAITEAVQTAQEGIVYCNSLISEEEEDF